MNILKEFPSEYVTAADVAAARHGGKPPPQLVVAAVIRGTGRDPKTGRDKDLPEMTFSGTKKRLRLNKSSIGMLVAAWGAETDAWKGKRVELHILATNLSDKTTGEKKLGVLARPAGDGPPPEDSLEFDGEIPE